jgi:hypothetical protein
MLNSRMSRRSFFGVAAAGLAATVLDWNKIKAFAEKMGARQDYPTVVIAAGLGGLCCAAYLAQQGDCVRLVPVGDVIYFKASDKYTEVMTHQGESLIRKPIFISPERFAAEAGRHFIWRLSSWPPRR